MNTTYKIEIDLNPVKLLDATIQIAESLTGLDHQQVRKVLSALSALNQKQREPEMEEEAVDVKRHPPDAAPQEKILTEKFDALPKRDFARQIYDALESESGHYNDFQQASIFAELAGYDDLDIRVLPPNEDEQTIRVEIMAAADAEQNLKIEMRLQNMEAVTKRWEALYG